MVQTDIVVERRARLHPFDDSIRFARSTQRVRCWRRDAFVIGRPLATSEEFLKFRKPL